MLQKHIWGEVGRLQSNVVNAVLDELMRAAVDGGLGSTRCEVIADVMTAVTSINVRGRIFARLRKVNRINNHTSNWILHTDLGLGTWKDIHQAHEGLGGELALG